MLPGYTGKSLDAFEDVWNMWMRCAGIASHIHADVLSFRCFAFSCGNDAAYWFSPVQTVEAALEELCGNLGLQEQYAVIPASEWDMRLAEHPIFAADVCFDVKSAAVRQQFYRGAPPFSLLSKHRNGKHLVYTAPSVPFMELSRTTAKDRLRTSKGYVLIGDMPFHLKPLPAAEILHRGMLWRTHAIECGDCLERLTPDSFEAHRSRYAHLAIQYGALNYQIQLYKLVKFCTLELRPSVRLLAELDRELLHISDACGRQAGEELVKANGQFWSWIKKIDEECYV